MLCYDNSIRPSSQELLNSSHPRPRWINIPIFQNKKCRKIFCNNYSWLNKPWWHLKLTPHDLWIPFVFTFPRLCFISGAYPFGPFIFFFLSKKVSFLAFFIRIPSSQHTSQFTAWWFKALNAFFTSSSDFSGTQSCASRRKLPKSWDSTIKNNGNGWCFSGWCIS